MIFFPSFKVDCKWQRVTEKKKMNLASDCVCVCVCTEKGGMEKREHDVDKVNTLRLPRYSKNVEKVLL